MSIKDSFIRDVKDLIANVQPKPDAQGYYKYLDNVEADLIANYSSCFGELETYEGYLIDGKPCYKLEHLNEKGEWVE